MPPRRSHLKSRRGCLTCKQRHVKCDEGGPPCGACKLRATACVYGTPASKFKTTPSTDATATPDVAVDPPGDELTFPTNHRLLELQLMHRWSTVTYKSVCTPVAEDDHVWLAKVPQLSLQFDFLLNGVFAVTAFEAAALSERDRRRYVSVAIEYQALALSSFQPQLDSITASSYEAVLCFSLVLMLLALASAQFTSDLAGAERSNMVQNTILHFELLRGCTTVLASNANYLEESPYVRKLTRFEDLPRSTLDAGTEAALAKLHEANDRRIKSSIHESCESRASHVRHWEACKKAIALLQEFFAKCVNLDYRGYVLGWLNMAGDDYVKAIQADDHVALLILMFWGVLVETLSHEVWWAKDFGRLLVEDVASRCLHADADATTKDVVSCARGLILKGVVADEVDTVGSC